MHKIMNLVSPKTDAEEPKASIRASVEQLCSNVKLMFVNVGFVSDFIALWFESVRPGNAEVELDGVAFFHTTVEEFRQLSIKSDGIPICVKTTNFRAVNTILNQVKDAPGRTYGAVIEKLVGLSLDACAFSLNSRSE